MRYYKFTIKGRSITKKSSQQIVTAGDGKKYIIQKKAYKRYEENAQWDINKFKSKFKKWIPLKDCYMVAEYWMPNNIGEPDLVGLLQATCDILEAGKIIENDKYIRQFGFDNRHSKVMGIDKENPRVEITLKEVNNGKE
jgi:Holliday junction resolvase RusA-like endonuclease